MDIKYQNRLDKVREIIFNSGLDFFFISSAANRYYLSGFELHDPQCNESSGYLLITKDNFYLLTDPRYEEAAKRILPEDNIFIYRQNKYERIINFLKEIGVKRFGFESVYLSYDFYDQLNKHFELVPLKNVVEQVRMIKDKDEVKSLQRSCALNHKVFEQIELFLTTGKTEAEIAWEVEKLFRTGGATELSFSTIVAVGPNAALPHAIPGKTKIVRNCPVLIDMGARVDYYCSDQTRTFWVGDSPSKEFLRTMELVKKAQEKAIKEIYPGLPIKDAYYIAKAFFQEYGVDKYFTHGLGHGIGLETHEPPAIGPLAKGVFKPGMVVTIEPGLYYPKWGGVRWEYMVLITDNGAEIL